MADSNWRIDTELERVLIFYFILLYFIFIFYILHNLLLLQRGPEGVWSVNNILYGNLPHQRQLDKNLCFNLPPMYSRTVYIVSFSLMLMNTTFSERLYISVSTCYPDLQIVYGTYFQVHCAIGKF